MRISQSSLQALIRAGLRDETQSPAPRLDASALRIHGIPIPAPPGPGIPFLRHYLGSPPPDRGTTRDWPGTGGVE